MTTKRTKRAVKTVNSNAAKRTLNPTGKGKANKARAGEGEPFSNQDTKRRSGRFEGKGEITRGGTRGK